MSISSVYNVMPYFAIGVFAPVALQMLGLKGGLTHRLVLNGVAAIASNCRTNEFFFCARRAKSWIFDASEKRLDRGDWPSRLRGLIDCSRGARVLQAFWGYCGCVRLG